MSKIKAVDFAKYVDDNRKYLSSTLKTFGKDVKETDSLDKLVSTTASLNVFPEEEEEIFDYPKEWKDLMEEYENDPLLTRNGGEYQYCQYIGLSDMYDTSYLYISSGLGHQPFIKTSDGQQIIFTEYDITITWDRSKDLTRENGQKYRWIKFYSKYTNIYPFGCPSQKNDTELGACLFCLYDSYGSITDGTSSSNQTSYKYLYNTTIECFVSGYNVTKTNQTTGSAGHYNLTFNLKNLKYIKLYNRGTHTVINTTYANILILDAETEKLEYTKFGLMDFKLKNTYTIFMQINRYESFLYFFNKRLNFLAYSTIIF